MSTQPSRPPHRRQLLRTLAALGVGTPIFHRALATQAEEVTTVTAEMVKQAEWIAGLELSEDARRGVAAGLNNTLRGLRAMREVALDNGVPPALVFDPTRGKPFVPAQKPGTVKPIEGPAPKKPVDEDDLAFLPLTQLASLVRTRQVSSVELTKLSLKRLRKYDPVLHCVVNYTEEVALKQAEQADKEIADGKYRGPLHGIPWGAKDLISYPGYKTTWGALPYKDRTLDVKATVAQKLEEAGAVLVAKLSLGALASGDRWFGGMTRNPWDPQQGSSGSSAGSASAVVAGCVGFAIGSETLGSIVSPCRRCGSSGLRPTFGRVSRHGCMSLAWSMDKLGPIARSIEDCALIFGAIHGADGLDPAAVDRPFSWPMGRELKALRVGYFEAEGSAKDRDDLRVLGDLGVQLIPIELPQNLPVDAMRIILTVEAAAVFDELTRKDVTEGLNTWPRTFRQGQFITAVEYLRANRLRTLLINQMEEVMEKVDAYVGGDDLVITNLTGHPSAVLPNGFSKRGKTETPYAITFTGRLHGETELLALAHAYQQATGFHLRRPPLG